MKLAAIENPRSRQEELGQFLTATPEADFMASIFWPASDRYPPRYIAWNSEVRISEDPDHMVHFNGERFLGPYPDATPKIA